MNFLDHENKISSVIKEKLKACGGSAAVSPMQKGKTGFEIAFTDVGIKTDKLPNQILEWGHFDRIIKKANSLGGKMYRGDQLAQHPGNALGYEIPHDCIEGFVASELLGVEDGKSITRCSTYYSGVLEWAGIATRHPAVRCVEPSFITVNEKYRDI